ncbi:hypothetical protein QQS21_003685 [Conoideocrella luteorostrata]|uniref:Uncharacterized protein n=1 Tax=Conoideocrella luteorostrata TaxID=1105319 RepID=A0AAJ0G0F8_9HYPO|nr:hypothetical protein QQS21_003685 [Conoideocrella luteorostrata]
MVKGARRPSASESRYRGRRTSDFRDHPRYWSRSPDRDDDRYRPERRDYSPRDRRRSEDRRSDNDRSQVEDKDSHSYSHRANMSSVRGNGLSRSSNQGRDAPLPPATTHETSPANTSQKEAEVKSLVDLLCDRMWWFMQCEQENKKEKKLRADQDRCPPGNSESTPLSDILSIQIEQSQKARKKCSDRINASDSKLLLGIGRFMEKQPACQSAAAQENGVKMDDLEDQLESFRRSFKASYDKHLEEEIVKVNDSFQSLQKETTELKKCLAVEKQRNDKLEKRLEELEQKFDSQSKKQDNLIQAASSKDKDVIDKAVADVAENSEKLKHAHKRLDDLFFDFVNKEELANALRQFDDRASSYLDGTTSTGQEEAGSAPGCKTRLCLQQLSDSFSRLESSPQQDVENSTLQCVITLQKKVEGFAETTQNQSEQNKLTSSALKSLEDSLSRMSSLYSEMNSVRNQPNNPSPAPTTSQSDVDDKIQRLSASLKEDVKAMMQKRLAKVATDLGSFIDKERLEREKTSEKAEKSSATVQLLHQTVDQLRTLATASVGRLNGQVDQQARAIHSCNDSIAAFDSRLQHLARENAEYAEALAMQLQVVNTWQCNFTTKPLYRDIVEHINATMPTATVTQISLLNSRVDAIEGLLKYDDGAMRKRKLPPSVR